MKIHPEHIPAVLTVPLISLYSPGPTESTLLMVLLISVGIDLVTGLLSSYKRKEPITSNRLGYTSIKLIAYFGLYLVVKAVAYICGSVLDAQQIGSVLTTAVLSFNVLRESLSILENCESLGVKLPKMLKKLMGRLEEEINDSE